MASKPEIHSHSHQVPRASSEHTETVQEKLQIQRLVQSLMRVSQDIFEALRFHRLVLRPSSLRHNSSCEDDGTLRTVS